MLDREDWRLFFGYELRRLRDLGLRPGRSRTPPAWGGPPSHPARGPFRRWWLFALFSSALHAGLLTALYAVRVSAPPPPERPRRIVTVRLLRRPIVRREAPRPRRPEPDPTPNPRRLPPRRATRIERPAPVRPRPAEPARPAARPAPSMGLGPGPGPPAHPFGWTRGEGRQAALARYGGDGSSEAAVVEGLDWLARHQDEDGTWDPAGFHRHCGGRPRCGGAGLAAYREGVTALALLAFLGARGDGPDSPYHATTHRAIEALLASQGPDGCLGPKDDHYMYNHAIATLALAEALALSGSGRLRAAVTRALRYTAQAQQRGGGWDYTEAATRRNDLSVTGWQVMALAAGRTAGIEPPEETVRALAGYLERVADADGSALYAETGFGAGRRGICMASVALLSRLLAGWSLDDPVIEAAADRIAREPPGSRSPGKWKTTFHSSYYWYYGTLALFHLGGPRWEAWNGALRPAVLRGQRKQGEARGSWDPEPNWISTYGGRVYATAANVLTLQVYYRYEPLCRAQGAREGLGRLEGGREAMGGRGS